MFKIKISTDKKVDGYCYYKGRIIYLSCKEKDVPLTIWHENMHLILGKISLGAFKKFDNISDNLEEFLFGI